LRNRDNTVWICTYLESIYGKTPIIYLFLWIPGQGDGDSEMIVMGIPK